MVMILFEFSVYESRPLDVVELREGFFQVRIAFRGDAALLGAEAARRAFAVAAVQTVDDLEAGHEGAERCETLPIELLLVFRQIDEELRRPRVRTGRRNRHRPPPVPLFPRTVGDHRATPRRLNRRVAVHTGLRDESFHHAQEAAVDVETVLYQIGKTVGGERI